MIKFVCDWCGNEADVRVYIRGRQDQAGQGTLGTLLVAYFDPELQAFTTRSTPWRVYGLSVPLLGRGSNSANDTPIERKMLGPDLCPTCDSAEREAAVEADREAQRVRHKILDEARVKIRGERVERDSTMRKKERERIANGGFE